MSQRIHKIKETYSEQLKERLKQEGVNISLDSAWDVMVSADPSHNKKNVIWLIETYIDNGYLWEDIASGLTSKVAETLVEFDKHKRNLEPSRRSLMKYQTLGSLWSSIKPYVGQLTANEEKREERDKAYSEAEGIVDREDGFKVIVPKTEYAAKWFGRGTRWCTSAENNNMFSSYAKQSPLFIIFMPDGDKLQLWKNDRNVQFMNENDVSVTKEYIEKNWNILEPIVCHIDLCKYYPDDKVTYEKFKDEVTYNFQSVRTIPDHLHDRRRELYEVAINISCDALMHIPVTDIDEELCKLAVQCDGRALSSVPHEFRTPEICKIAVKNHGDSISHVHSEDIDEELCDLAVKYNGMNLRYVPNKFRTQELCEMAIRDNGNAIGYTHMAFRTREFCEIAVQTTATAYFDIPNDLKNDNQFIELTVKSGGNLLEFIPEDKKTYKVCELAVQQNGIAIQFVPDKLRTVELYKSSMKTTGMALQYIPDQLKDEDMCKEAVTRDYKALWFVPKRFATLEVYELAIRNNPWAIAYVSDAESVLKLAPLAISLDSNVISSIPDHLKSDEFKRLLFSEHFLVFN